LASRQKEWLAGRNDAAEKSVRTGIVALGR
jgi:hypothetical protein